MNTDKIHLILKIKIKIKKIIRRMKMNSIVFFVNMLDEIIL